MFVKSGNLNQMHFSLQREDSRESTGSKWEWQGAQRNGSRGSSKPNAASLTGAG